MCKGKRGRKLVNNCDTIIKMIVYINIFTDIHSKEVRNDRKGNKKKANVTLNLFIQMSIFYTAILADFLSRLFVPDSW